MASRQLRAVTHGEYRTLSSKTTTVNTYVDVDSWDTLVLKTKRFQFTATTNDLTVRVLGSLDGGTTYPLTAIAEFAVTVLGSPVTQVDTTFYTNIKVQVKPTVADTHGSLATKVAGANF